MFCCSLSLSLPCKKCPVIFLYIFFLIFIALRISNMFSVFDLHSSYICVHLSYFCKQVIPFTRGSALDQPPPDLPSYLFKNRIVYLGMSLVPSVTELILAEFLYLQYDDAEKPIYLYINSTGTTKVNCVLYFIQFASDFFQICFRVYNLY